MPDNVTVQVRRHPSSRETVTTVNKKDERRQESISVHSCRLDLRNVVVWWLVSLLLISEVRKHLSRFEVSRGFPLFTSNKCLLVPQIKALPFLICLYNSLFTTILYSALLKASLENPLVWWQGLKIRYCNSLFYGSIINNICSVRIT